VSALAAGTHTLGPDNARLLVRTYREGAAAKVGHDLILEVASWEATLTIDDSGAAQAKFSADPRSIEVVEGLRGLKPLSAKDKNDIVKNIDQKSLKGHPIAFHSSEAKIDEAGGGLSVRGELELGGNKRQLEFTLALGGDGQLTGAATVKQSDWGIKPYSGMLGALKVKDEVEVALAPKP
jgi:polyisoprenoid-binding protein YceI